MDHFIVVTARHDQAAAVELDLVGHELARRHTRFPVPVHDNATLVPPVQAVDSALDTSPHGESQDILAGVDAGKSSHNSGSNI